MTSFSWLFLYFMFCDWWLSYWWVALFTGWVMFSQHWLQRKSMFLMAIQSLHSFLLTRLVCQCAVLYVKTNSCVVNVQCRCCHKCNSIALIGCCWQLSVWIKGAILSRFVVGYCRRRFQGSAHCEYLSQLVRLTRNFVITEFCIPCS
jgi:hypothetical protein